MDNPIRLHWLDPRNPDQPFPPADQAMAEPNGLLAIGGDLSPTRMVRAYSQGIFPWYNPDEPILWWCPDPRAVLRPGGFRVSRSLRKVIRRADYAVTMNRAFDRVIQRCAAPRERQRGTWLGPDMRHAYRDLHHAGFCQSVEIWRNQQLIGGLYGISLGRSFFGESMFSGEDNGSKLALYYLSEQLAVWQFDLIDCQISSDHLYSLGAEDLPRQQFLRELEVSVRRPGRTGPWSLTLSAPADPHHLPAR